MMRFSACALTAAATLFAFGPTANATLIDFNQVQGSDGDFTFDTPTDGPLGATGISLDFDGAINDSGSGTDHQGAYPIAAAKDYFFANTGSTAVSGTITLEGLTGPAYDITIYSSIASDGGSGGVRISDITVNGVFSEGGLSDDYDPFTQGFNNGTLLTWSNVVPVAGEIEITLSIPAASGVVNTGVINALEFTVIPEPATAVLAGLGALVMLARPRRHAGGAARLA